jgi:CBS domain-containing protein
MNKPVSTIMQKIVLPVAMNDTVSEVEAMLKSHRISCAPVYNDEDGKVLGIITVSDLSRLHAAGRDAGQIKAWEICSYHPVEVAPETPIAKVAELMLEHRIHHVIVMQDGSMKGIVSSLDFVKLALDHGN